MLELRQRSRSAGSATSGGYQAVDTDDELDSVPILDLQIIKVAPPAKSTICVKLCFIFSLSGVLFLSSIYFMLYEKSKYIKISQHDPNHKRELAEGVSGAILMYVVCTVISGVMWYRSSNEAKYRDDDLRLLD